MKNRFLGALAFAAIGFSAFGCRDSGPGMVPVTEQEIASHIRFLSDDILEGRSVGSPGIGIAERYQEDLFRTFGLEPLFPTGFQQAFDLRETKPDPGAALEIVSGRTKISPVLFEEFVVNSEREDCPPAVSGEMVYCGYLIQAPEREWDDIKGADLKGKVILCEVNEPGNAPGGIFDGEDMTYYGRWTYKFEKAAELGAAGVFIIHNDKGAAYGWHVVRTGWSKESYFLPDRNPSLMFQGWLSGSAADAVFAAAKLDRAKLVEGAGTPGFSPVPLGMTATVRERPTFRTVAARNVAGLVRAKAKGAGDRYVIVTAHHDHLGKDATLPGDQIFNGAVDNCSATASMLALASYYAQRPEALSVNLVFSGVTAEEHQQLGSDYLARHLPFPDSAVLACINFEMTNVWGETEDVYAIGAGHSDLDEICRLAAGDLGLAYTAERNANLGFFFRSDQISFVRAGIPAVWLHHGIIARDPDGDRVRKAFEAYLADDYHKVTDEMRPDWDLRGTLEMVRWAQAIIRRLEIGAAAPEFKPGSPFRRKNPASGFAN